MAEHPDKILHQLQKRIANSKSALDFQNRIGLENVVPAKPKDFIKLVPISPHPNQIEAQEHTLQTLKQVQEQQMLLESQIKQLQRNKLGVIKIGEQEFVPLQKTPSTPSINQDYLSPLVVE